MMIDANRSWLLVVDIQEKLVAAVHQADQFVENCAWLVELAAMVGVPIVFSEQYPKGLGHTLPRLTDLAPAAQVVEKVHFSCLSANCLPSELLSQRKQVIICGMESHVCVLQTTLGLINEGKEVYVVADVVSSRTTHDIQLALARMQQAGAVIVSREMVLFEWLRQAGTPQFKAVSARFLQATRPAV
ncbi:nicotinamidase-related amidase [Chitinivorax tropicus]|uniref:Nicotinamidase-related amidase n=1 Tax=Chitinivorax tropicus TaxID=714531 RepID=A0A840MJA7_9PROT|nr:hydrolase [Chitinivorax tropicus]MBB5019284.1 nicotinamidase-related amidase [Chitinivorax tropicus]